MHLITPLAALIDRVAADPAHVAARAAFCSAARQKLAALGLVARPRSLADLLADARFPMKYRERPAHRPDLDQAGWERFALSLGDCERTKPLADLLPALAVVVRLEGDPALLIHLRDQLHELATWTPLMRSGWSSGKEGDGAWLGTAWAVRAIHWTLALLPAGSLEPALVAALEARLEAELDGILSDWSERRPWFVRDDAVYSNQWALPLEALLLCALHTKSPERRRTALEHAVAGLLRTLDAQGPRGEFVEGVDYGSITMHSVHSAARAAAEAGDRRLLDHAHLRTFPLWFLHHRQPGGRIINAFDTMAQDLDHELLARAVTDVGHPQAAWVLARRPLPPESVSSLAALPLLSALAAPPPLFAAYEVAARVNWVSHEAAFGPEPESRVSGFWMRGGHATDAHDHQDRGHVNLIVRGRPVLIEAGLASYGAPEHPTHYRGVAGHNVLQVGPWSPGQLTKEVVAAGAGQPLVAAHRAAPLTVHRLDARGGLVECDGSRCYPGLKRWTRRVEWDADSATIADEVELVAPEVVVFRWHLGAPADAAPRWLPGGLRIDGLRLDCEGRGDADVPVELSLEPMPDRTLTKNGVGRHATVVARSAAPVTRFTLRTRASCLNGAGVPPRP